MAVIVAQYNKRIANCRKPPYAITTGAHGVPARNHLLTCRSGLEGPGAAVACWRGDGVAGV